jgi:hypothetical protein
MEPVGDIERQANRLIELLTDEPLHQRLSAAARETALTRFCTDLIIPQYERYYEQVCASAGTSNHTVVSNQVAGV